MAVAERITTRDASYYIALAIYQQIENASVGHCVRVNHLSHDLSVLVLGELNRIAADHEPSVISRILSPDGSGENPDLIRMDQATEIRNRKRGIFCLFVPSSAHNATASSLGNSFAEVNGTDVTADALDLFLSSQECPSRVREAVASIRAAFARLNPQNQPTTSDLLSFAIEAARLCGNGRDAEIGKELWRARLIPDSGEDFELRLRRNRVAVAALTRPAKMTASIRERVATLGLTHESARTLEAFFLGIVEPLEHVKGWTRLLAQPGQYTFDQWQFKDSPVPSDCEQVLLLPFLDERGRRIDKNAGGLHQEFAGAPLLALVGEKKKLSVRWETKPLKTNVARWRLEIVSADNQDLSDAYSFELPLTEVRKGSTRLGSLNLNLGLLEESDIPRNPLRVRIRALTETGEEVLDREGAVLEAVSDEFYLTLKSDIAPPASAKERSSTAVTLAGGLLRQVVENSAAFAGAKSPQWHPADHTTRFALKVTDRDFVTVVQSSVLHELQNRLLKSPSQLGGWVLSLDDVRAASIEAIDRQETAISESTAYRKFLRERSDFFKLVHGVGDEHVRNHIEVADWTEQLVTSVCRYASQWADWLNNADGAELHAALSTDTLRVVVGDGRPPAVDALVVLPTHPLRALWFASHFVLTQQWAEELEQLEGAKRKLAVDLEMASRLLPANVPPLLFHPSAAQPFIFFDNLDAGHGVAFPSDAPNAAAQLATLKSMLGLSNLDSTNQMTTAARTAVTLQRFHETHPYADPFQIAVVNPDDGTLVQRALGLWEEQLFQQQDEPGTSRNERDELNPLEVSSMALTAYVHEHNRGSLQLLRQWGADREDRITKHHSDHLRPSFSTTASLITELEDTASGTPADHYHLAVCHDLAGAHPVVIRDDVPGDIPLGLSLYGLVVRYEKQIRYSEKDLLLRCWVNVGSSIVPHPVDKQLSDATLKAHRAASSAAVRFLDPGLPVHAAGKAGLQIRLDERAIHLIDEVHRRADWVLTVDRFIGPELFDYPDSLTEKPPLGRSYILDASPDFEDGVVQRSMVTTSSRAEVETILLKAMGRFGFQQLRESVGDLVQTLRTVSGRLVLDALQSDTRAAEIVGIGAVITWLKGQNQVRDSLIVPIDSHLDLFGPHALRGQQGLQRCDLALFRFKSANRLEVSLIEVKSRSNLSQDIDRLTEEMAVQMRSTAAVIVDRWGNMDRVDSVLQRSMLSQVLRFYLERAVRFAQIDEGSRSVISKRLSALERGGVEIETRHRGFVISLDNSQHSRQLRIDEQTTIQVLTVSEIAKASPGIHVSGDRDEVSQQESSNGVGQPASARAADQSSGPSDASSTWDRKGMETNVARAGVSDVEEGSQSVEVEKGQSNEAAADDPPTPAQPSQDVLVATVDQDPIVWQPRVAGSPHLFILGIPGQGKTVTIERILTELAKTGTPALVLDYHGTFASEAGSYAQRANAVLLDAAEGLPFSPLAIDPYCSKLELAHHTKEIANVVDHVFGLGEIQSDVFYRTLRRLYDLRGFGATDVGSPKPEPPRLDDLARALERNGRDQGVRNLLARTRTLFEFDLFTPPEHEAETFEDMLHRGLVVSMHRLGGDELSLMLSAFLLRKIYLSITKWPVADRLKLVIVLDEAHRLARDVTLPKLMKEGRKYGVAIVIASQGLADFHPDVVGNAGTKISFRINHPDSRKVAGFFKGGPGQDLADVLEGLSVGQALVQTPEMKRAMRASMLRPD